MVKTNKAPQKPAARAPEIRVEDAATTGGQDFVVTALQSSADDTIKLAYGSMTLPSKQFLDLFAKVGEQYMSFVAKRMQAQAERVQTLARCANIEEVAKAEAAFYGKAAEDYAEQIDRLSETTHAAANAVEGKA